MANTEATHEQGTDMETADEMRVYEVGFHLIPMIPEEELAATVSRVKTHVTNAGAELIAESFPQKIELAYTMEHETGEERKPFDSAFFGWFAFTAEPAQIEAVQQAFDSDEQVLRFLCTITTKEAAERQRDLAQNREQVATQAQMEEQEDVAAEEEKKTDTKNDVSDADIDRAIGSMTQ